MKPIFWIYLVVNVLAVLGFFAYLISRAKEAAKNPKFFKMKEREKSIYLAKKHIKKHKKLQNSVMPDFFVVFATILFAFQMILDFKFYPVYLILYVSCLLLRFWPVTFTIEKDSFSFTHFAFFTQRFFFKDLKRMKIRYRHSYRGNSSYVISVFDKQPHFAKDVSIWNESMLHVCFIDAAFRSNPNIEMEIVDQNHQSMPELQDLMLARKPLGIFQNDQ